jgi:hypothetical protein
MSGSSSTVPNWGAASSVILNPFPVSFSSTSSVTVGKTLASAGNWG